MFSKNNTQNGFSVVEIIVASAIIVTLVTAIGGGWQIYLKTTKDATNFTMAANLSEEGAEGIQLMRDKGWTANIATLSLDVPYDLYWDVSTSTYKATTTPQLLQSAYRRTVTFSSIERDALDTVTTSGGTVDANTRKATINIYLGSSTSTPLMQSEILVHNIYAN